MTGIERPSQWQLEEKNAESYERYLVPLFFAPGAQYLIELSDLKPGERVLDLACGTGIVARTVAHRVGPNGVVVGLDINESMLAVARKASVDVISPPIRWKRGDASSIPFSDASFDVVFCQQGLQFFPDRFAAIRETHRVLAPAGRLVLSSMRPIEHNTCYKIFSEALGRHLGPAAAAIMRSPFLPLQTDELRRLLNDAGFRDERITIGIGPVRYPSVKEFVSQEAASSPLAGLIQSLSDNAFEALILDLEKALSAHIDDNGIVFPTESYLVAVRK